MTVERKWCYWHRVIWVDNDTEEGAVLKLGSLIGLNGKTPSCARMVMDDKKKSINLKDYVKLKFLGRLLRTATPEQVVELFGPAMITVQPNLGCESRKVPRGGVPYCTFKGASDRNKRLLCDANFCNGRCPAGLKPIQKNPEAQP